MKKIIMLIITLSLVLPSTAFCFDKIGEISVKRRIIQSDDTIDIIAIDDPDNPFITCYLTSINSGKILATSDPSNMSIACRATGKIPSKSQIVKKTDLSVFKLSKSIGLKSLRIARHYDAKRNVLVYTAYSTKILDGSYKHSMSVVPLN
jgi:CreA protein